jgi:hypothetical protein
LKGTPYYSTETDRDERSAKDRVPAWPLVYYRSPTLSVLWPFIEVSDEFMAFRPLASVYGLDKPRDQRVYSLLWPLGQFNRAEKENRFFPVFWGDGYAVGFPLYWHLGHPSKPEGGMDALIPLWWYSKDRHGYSANILWPLINVKDQPDGRGWRVWPLAGAYRDGADRGYYRFVAWPLAHQWSSGRGGEKGEAVLPLYVRLNTRGESSFYSLLYSRHRDADSSWDLLLPLLYHSRNSEGSKTFTPLYFRGVSADRKSAWQLLLPLYYSNRNPASRTLISLIYSRYRDEVSSWDLVFPLVYHSRDPEGKKTLSPLFFQGESADRKSAWQLLLPLYYSSRNPEGRTLVTLLGGRIQDEEGTGWAALPLLAGGVHKKDGTSLFLSVPWSSGSFSDGSRWALIPPVMFKTAKGKDRNLYTPLYAAGTRDEGTRSWQTVIPLWYRSEGDGETMLATLLGGWQTDHSGRRWLIWPLLSGGHRGDKGRDIWVAAPLFHARWDQAGLSHHLLPLYWWDAHDRRLISPVVSTWGNAASGRKTTLVPPALTLYSSEPRRKDLWTLAGLAHLSWGEQPGSSHVLPLYYTDPRSGTFLSLPWSRWTGQQGSTNTLIAPALSWLTRRKARSDLWAVGPLAHFSWGAEAGQSHVLPLYYSNSKSGTFLSLLWSRWKGAQGSTNTLIAPILSWLTRRENRSDLWALGPLAHFSWGKKQGASHIFPLFYRNKSDGTFVSLPYAHWKDGETERDLYPPLLSMYTRTGGEKRLDALLGLFSERWGEGRHDGYLLPLYYYDAGHSFYTPLFGWNKDPEAGYYYPLTPLVGVRTGSHSGGWLFPLWSRDHDKAKNETSGNFLWGTYSKTAEESESSLIPLFSYRDRKADPGQGSTNFWGGTYGKTFWCLPAIWYRNTMNITPVLTKEGRPSGQTETSLARDHGCFPLWTYTHLKTPVGGDETFGSLLMPFYDYNTSIKPAESPGVQPQTYVRRRVLWRFWHYERNNDTVSVDIFPAITYDRAADGNRRWAFLWRAFRYEKGPEGRKLDLLFIPLLRQSAAAAGKRE